MYKNNPEDLFMESLSTTFVEHGFAESFDLNSELAKVCTSDRTFPIKESYKVKPNHNETSLTLTKQCSLCHEDLQNPQRFNSECLICSPSLSLGSTNCTESDGQPIDLLCSQTKKSKAKKVNNPALNTDGLRKIWNERDYENLMDMAIRFRHNWKKIAKIILETTNIKPNPQALQRIHEKLVANRDTKRVKFTHEDDLMIVKFYNLYGIDWVKIASHLTDKSPVMIKNRFYSFIKKKDLIEEYTNEMDCLEEKEIEMTQTDSDSRVQTVKNLLEEDEAPFFNKTFYELHQTQPESELHERVTEMF